ncbi:MipA/OmpV family protein [Faucicola mancuniensis]|uniref:MipA/OmpV family protein n=1 Tax=Faucicola mancuniensis TaxID=1309795 RepID=UPI0039777115
MDAYSPSSSVQPFVSVPAFYRVNPKVNLFAIPSVTYYADEIYNNPKVDSRTSWGVALGANYAFDF